MARSLHSDVASFDNCWIPEPNTGCWLWMGALSKKGYGKCLRARLKETQAHRVTLLIRGVEIPEGFQVDHRCRVRSCVNPDHLRIVTPKENTLANGSLSNGAKNKVKTHCRLGHEYNHGNTYTHDGKRNCRVCNALAVARFRARRKP